MPDRVLPLAEVERVTNRKKSWLYARMARGEFPKRLDSGWLESEVQAWLRQQAAKREAAQ